VDALSDDTCDDRRGSLTPAHVSRTLSQTIDGRVRNLAGQSTTRTFSQAIKGETDIFTGQLGRTFSQTINM